MSSWLPNPFKPSSPDDTPSMFSAAITAAANFLAPPPVLSTVIETEEYSGGSLPSMLFAGIKSDLLEIFGFLRVKSDDDHDDGDIEVAGVNEEIIRFVEEVSGTPQCWTQFPLQLDFDFNMSDAQREHAATVEHLVPSLEALRYKVCTSLSEEQFWMIYFILLLPRLNDNDSSLLSTPELVEVREILLQKLQNKIDESPEISKDSETSNTISGVEMSKTDQKFEEDIDEAVNAAENGDVVSFSELDYDSNDLSDRQVRFRQEEDSYKTPSRSESSEWVRLNESSRSLGGTHIARTSFSREKYSEGEESSDWLRVDDVDLDSVAAP